jgi:toxin ParE1/3/4
MRAVPTPAAVRDIAFAAADIAGENPRVARAFIAATNDAAINLGRYPEMGPERPELADPPIRFWPLVRYRYVMVYRPDTVPPRILRVLHAARDLPSLLCSLNSD